MLSHDPAFSLWDWLKSHMAQLMVAVNGVILTLTAFVAVSAFVEESLHDEYASQNEVVRQDMTVLLGDMLDSLGRLTVPGTNPKQTQGKSASFDPTLYEQVYVFDVKSETVITRIKQSSRSRFPPQELVKSLALQPRKTALITEGDMQPVKQQAGLFVSVRSFAILVQSQNIPNAYIVAYVDPRRFSEELMLEKILSLKRADISFDGDVSPFYVMRNNRNDQTGNSSSSLHNITMRVESPLSDVIFSLSYRKPRQMLLIEVVPWILLGFGLTLTVIGWMYVWNNQQKTVLLSSINETLEIKNRELGQEIVEREKLNQILRKSERENKAIINAVSDVIFEMALNGDILFLNEAWTKVTGFQIDEMIGQNLFSLIHLHDQEEQRRNVSQLVKGQRQAYRTITRLRNIDGTFRSVEMAVSMLRLDEARNLRIVGSFTDIDSRERAEKALVEAEQKYRAIWENAAGGIYQISLDGQILSANPAMARIFGYDLVDHMMKEVINAHQQLFVQPQERLRALKALKGTDDPLTLESQAYRKDGAKIWVQENLRAVSGENGEALLYFEGSIEEITARKETEIKLREAKMESDVANRAKSEFLANMSHELRTPLNSIIGFSEIIKNEVFGPISPRPYWEYARDIHESGKHLLNIINQILDISRIDAGERELRDSLVDIPKVVRNSLDIVMPKIKAAGLNIVEVGLDKPRSIIAEEVAIKQMLINILSNSIKFTPSGGRVTISVEIDDHGALRISVTDTGVGLDDAEIEKAMSPFGVLDGRTNKSTSGIGLGLSLVQALMRLHDGHLEIFSQKGIGTTVTLIFPAERVQS